MSPASTGCITADCHSTSRARPGRHTGPSELSVTSSMPMNWQQCTAITHSTAHARSPSSGPRALGEISEVRLRRRLYAFSAVAGCRRPGVGGCAFGDRSVDFSPAAVAGGMIALAAEARYSCAAVIFTCLCYTTRIRSRTTTARAAEQRVEASRFPNAVGRGAVPTHARVRPAFPRAACGRLDSQRGLLLRRRAAPFPRSRAARNRAAAQAVAAAAE